LHYVYAEIPTITEALRYLELVFAPPPPLYQAIIGAVRRSVSQGHIPGPRHKKRASYRVVQRRATANQFSVRKKPSQRTFALLQQNNQRYEKEKEQQAGEAESDQDDRARRHKRIGKHPDIGERFRRGFPMMIFVSDSPILERRIDYHIRQDDRYVNVFHLSTPITRPAPIGGEWGENSPSSDEELSSVSEESKSSS
jgi:hypothetical protein